MFAAYADDSCEALNAILYSITDHSSPVLQIWSSHALLLQHMCAHTHARTHMSTHTQIILCLWRAGERYETGRSGTKSCMQVHNRCQSQYRGFYPSALYNLVCSAKHYNLIRVHESLLNWKLDYKTQFIFRGRHSLSSRKSTSRRGHCYFWRQVNVQAQM